MRGVDSARLGALGLVGVWVSTQWLVPSPGAARVGTAAAIGAMSASPIVTVAHLVLTDALAPVLMWMAVCPVAVRVASRESRFAVALSGASASMMSLIQLCIGIWLAVGRPGSQVAAFAGARTLDDLDGTTSLLLVVAICTLLAHGPRPRGGSTANVALLVVGALVSAAVAVGHVVHDEILASPGRLPAAAALVALGCAGWTHHIDGVVGARPILQR